AVDARGQRAVIGQHIGIADIERDQRRQRGPDDVVDEEANLRRGARGWRSKAHGVRAARLGSGSRVPAPWKAASPQRYRFNRPHAGERLDDNPSRTGATIWHPGMEKPTVGRESVSSQGIAHIAPGPRRRYIRAWQRRFATRFAL